MKKLLFILISITLFSQILSADEPRLVIDPQGHSDMIKDVMFTPNGKVLVSVSRDKTIRLWDVETGNLIKTIRGEIEEGYKGEIFSGALSPDGKILAVGGYLQNNIIRLINLYSGKQIATLKGHNNNVYALAFSPDGKLLASGGADYTIKIWSIADLDANTFKAPETTIQWKSNYIYDIDFSPDCEKLVIASTHTGIGLCKKVLKKWLKFPNMKGHNNEVYRVVFSPDGKYIVSGGADRKILLWDGNGNFIKKIDKLKGNINTISFSSDSQKIVAAEKGTFNAYVYSIPSGEKITTFTSHDNTVVASAFYSENVVATAGGKDNDIFIWDAISGKVKTHIVGKGKPVHAIAFGKNLNVAFGTNEALEKSFNFSTMSLNQEIPKKIYFRGTILEYSGEKLKKGGLYKLRITEGEVIKNNIRYDGEIRCYTFTEDGDVVVGSSYSLKLYKNNGGFIRQFMGHTGEIWAVSVSRNGKILVSASSDQTIKLWNIKNGELLATLFVTTDNEWICWTPKGYYAASAGGEKYIGWHINQGVNKSAEYYPVYTFRKQFYYPGLVINTIEQCSFEKALAKLKTASKEEIVEATIQQFLPPKVEWIYPTHSIETDKSFITIEAKITSDTPIDEIKILLNGRNVATERGIKITTITEGFAKSIKRDIWLNPRENEIAIIAKNQNAISLPEMRIVRYIIGQIFKPNLYVLSIGISDYHNSDLSLNYPDDDAKAFTKMMKKQSGGLYKKVIIKNLTDNDATRGNILDGLDWLRKEATQKDVVMIFFASHGYNDTFNNYYILPVEGNPEKLLQTGIGWYSFAEVLGNLPAKVLLFLDTCHSGQLGVKLIAMLRGQDDITEVLREISSDENGVIVFAASTGRESSMESHKWKHGAFTKAIIDGLKEGNADYNNDGIIYVRELDNYLSERVKELTEGKQHTTTLKPSTISRMPIYKVK